jgi:Asp/Glu/hydantoin racemase
LTGGCSELLVINPNTTGSMTRLLHQHVQEEVGSTLEVRSATASFGAPYIVDEATYAVAAQAVLDLWQKQEQEPAAVLIGCFGDPGLFALRQASTVPVTGLAEAAFAEAARYGRFAVVTGGAPWQAMLERLAQALGCTQLAGIHTVTPTGAQMAADPKAARALLAIACKDAVRRFDARAVILGGAGLAGMAADLQPQASVPLIDSVRAGARHAARLLAGSRAKPPPAAPRPP